VNNTTLSTTTDIKEFLRPLLFGLAEEDLDELAQAAVVRPLPAGEVVCREGDAGDAVYAVVQGQVEIVKQIDEDHERHLLDMGPGGIFGEMAILQEGPRTATVRTTEPTAILEIGREPFLKVLGRSPSLGIRMAVRMTTRLRDSDQQAIAELRQANEELTRALRQLEQLDKTKTDFIQVSAHELRTPVAALLGYAQMIEANPIAQEDPQLRALVEGIVGSTKRLHRVFNNILDVSRIMAGGLKINRTPVSIPVVIDGILVEFKEALEERNLILEQQGLQGLPLYPGEPDLLYKVFYHLVNNAIKYTPDGGKIRVTGQTLEIPDLGPSIEVAVQDTGIGIAPADLEVIFEKFYHAGEVALHSSGTTKFKGGGSGLGLAIVRGMVVAHGGRIWAESPGYSEETCPGSRFVVQLPFPESELLTSANPQSGS
jgi:signal transduction histidine kinase